MKQQHVRERVYESGRLARAWQQVRQNAVAAGIDEEQMAQSVTRKEVRFVLNLQWFRERGLFLLHDFTGGQSQP